MQRGSLTIWMDEQVIQQWHCQSHHGRRGRGFHYSDTAIETALMVKGLFKLPLRALEGFINSLFQLMAVPLQSPDYNCISKRAKTVDINYRLPSQSPVAHLVIDATGLKVYGEGEWKIRKHGKEKRRVWRKLHLAVNPVTHDIVAAEVSLENVHDAEGLLDKLPGCKGAHPNRIAPEIEQAILDYSLTRSTHGPLRVAQELALQGINVSADGVRGVCQRHDLLSKHDRLLAPRENVPGADSPARALQPRVSRTSD